jgi:hypothetical protein
MPLYLNSPEFCNKEVTHFEGLPKLYCQNELAFVRFPQSEQSVLATQRKLVRALWLQCFHGKDFEGALMVIQSKFTAIFFNLTFVFHFLESGSSITGNYRHH